MLLILNCIKRKEEIDYFDNIIVGRILNDSLEYRILHITDFPLQFDLSPFSHLLITGSELSASKENEWDNEIYRIIKYFIKESKAILGICYGHQMLAKAILGNESCRKAKIPEFGWKRTKIVENPIFENITKPIFAMSHYDEVCNLTNDFNVIAFSNECIIQAFQYKNLPIWGVQFHPEMDFDDGNRMFNDNLRDPLIRKFFVNKIEDKKKIEQNKRVIWNFLECKT